MDKNLDLTPKNDVIFKKLFGDPNHPKFLIALLNAVLKPESPITKVTIKNSELTPEFVGQKGVRLDVLAETEDSHVINVEIQKKDEQNMRNRVPFNLAKILVAEAEQGQKYEDLKKVTTINIINFRLFESEEYWNRFFFISPDTGEKLTDLLEIHFLELPKVKGPIKDDRLTFWLEFIKNPEIQHIKGDYDWERVYGELKQRYNDIIADPEVQELIRVRDKAERDYNSAMYQAWVKGQEDGRKEAQEALDEAQKALDEEKVKAQKALEKAEAKAHQEKIESAKQMLSDGLPVDLIAKYSGLPIEELQNLAQALTSL